MPGRVDEADPMTGVLKEHLPGRHGLEDAALALEPEVDGDVAAFGDEPHKHLRLVSVELVENEDPDRLWVLVDGSPNVLGEVFLGPGWADGWLDCLPRRDLEVRDQAERAVAPVLEFTELREPGQRRLGRMEALQRLDARLLIDADDVRALGVKPGGVRVGLTDRTYGRLVLLRVLQLVL